MAEESGRHPLLHHSNSTCKWKRLAEIGRGSNARVWLAELQWQWQRHMMAVKTAEEGTSKAESLRREFRILKSLRSCKRIVGCLGHDITEEQGIRFHNLLIEYMPRGSVSELLRRSHGGLTETTIPCFVRDLLEALQCVHRNGFVHGDVKGGNVLVGVDGRAKLADFGAAKRIGESSFMSGTPLWSAPEVAVMGEQGPPSDIWSVGCTVIEMVSGRPPWTGCISEDTDAAGALYRIGCSDDVPSVARSLLSVEGLDFLSKCLVRDPSKRWTSEQLLSHAFVNGFDECGVKTLWQSPLSPVSPLDFGIKEWDEEDDVCSTHGFYENHRSVPPEERIQKLAQGEVVSGCGLVKNSVSDVFFTDDGFGEWIHVRGNPAMFTPLKVVVSSLKLAFQEKQDCCDACITSKRCDQSCSSDISDATSPPVREQVLDSNHEKAADLLSVGTFTEQPIVLEKCVLRLNRGPVNQNPHSTVNTTETATQNTV